MGLEDGLAKSSLRFGLGRNTTEEEIEFVIERVTCVVKDLRRVEKRIEV